MFKNWSLKVHFKDLEKLLSEDKFEQPNSDDYFEPTGVFDVLKQFNFH